MESDQEIDCLLQSHCGQDYNPFMQDCLPLIKFDETKLIEDLVQNKDKMKSADTNYQFSFSEVTRDDTQFYEGYLKSCSDQFKFQYDHLKKTQIEEYETRCVT